MLWPPCLRDPTEAVHLPSSTHYSSTLDSESTPFEMQGHTEAWFHLGVMHLNGWGTGRNVQQAQYFFSMAAKVGHTLGTYNLAMLQLNRDAASCPHALELLKKVAGELRDAYRI